MKKIFSWAMILGVSLCSVAGAADFFYVGDISKNVDGKWVKTRALELFADKSDDVQFKTNEGSDVRTWTISKDGSVLQINVRDSNGKKTKFEGVFGQIFFNVELDEPSTRLSLILKYKKGVTPLHGAHRLSLTTQDEVKRAAVHSSEREHHGHGRVTQQRQVRVETKPFISGAEARLRHWEQHIDRGYADK